MQTDLFVYLLVGAVSIFYILVLMSGRAGSGHDFYTLHTGVTPIARGMGLAADWLCAATFLTFFGLLSQDPQHAQWLLVGWLSGLVVLGAWVAPGVYHSGQSCLTGLVTCCFDSASVRYLFLITLTVIGVVILALQLKGMGLVFSRHLQVSTQAGVSIALLLLLFYVVISGMRAITRVQMLKFCIILCGLIVPAIYLASEFSLPSHWVFLQSLTPSDWQVTEYEQGLNIIPALDVTPFEWILTVLVLLTGTSILPYMLKRFQGTKAIQDVRFSAIWMLVFVGVIYASMPWMGSVEQSRFSQVVNGSNLEGVSYSRLPTWFFAWEQTDSFFWQDENQDGRVQYSPVQNELTVAKEVKLLVLPELFEMDPWIIALLTVAIIAALLSTASIILIATVHSWVLQSSIVLTAGRFEVYVTRGLAFVLLMVAAVIAISLTGSLIEWMNRMIALAAAALFPAVALALLFRNVAPIAVAMGIIVGLVCSVSYSLAYDLQWLPHLLPHGWPFYSPVAVAAVAMCLNWVTVLSLTWVLQARSVDVG